MTIISLQSGLSIFIFHSKFLFTHTKTHTCRGTPTLLPISLTTEAVTAVVA